MGVESFRAIWDEVRDEVNQTANEKGHNENFDPLKGLLLMHQELSECVDALRDGNPPDNHCPQFDSLTVEMADLLIRMMAFASMMKLDIPGALFAKKEYNKSRPYKHGRKF